MNMFCKNCGTQIEDGKNFCPNCGASLENAPETPVVEVVEPKPVYESAQTYTVPQGEAPDASSLMTKGIVGAALCEIGIPGIVLGNIAMKGALARKEEGYRYSGKLKAAYITGKVAKIVGIIMTIFWAVYILVIGIIIGQIL